VAAEAAVAVVADMAVVAAVAVVDVVAVVEFSKDCLKILRIFRVLGNGPKQGTLTEGEGLIRLNSSIV
jgi:hypothetical protein